MSFLIGRRLAAGLLSLGLTATALLVVTAAPASAGHDSVLAPTTSWWYTDSATPDSSYHNPTPSIPVGASVDAHGAKHISRAYGTFDLTGFAGTHLFGAQLSLQVTPGSSCVGEQLEVWATDGLPANPTWHHAPRELAKLATIGGTAPCPYSLQVDLTPFVAKLVAAKEPLPSQVTLEVRVPTAVEGTVSLGRQLAVGYNGGIGFLTITRNTIPGVPTNLSAGGKPCATSAPYPYVTNDPAYSRLRLDAVISDPDGNESLTAEIDMWPVNHPDQSQTFTATTFYNGTGGFYLVPAGALMDGSTYAWKMRASDGIDTSAWSATCHFTLDNTSPAAAPLITSASYPVQNQGYPGGVPGTFTFSANGVSDVLAYAYSFNGGAPVAAMPSRIGGSVTVSVSPPDVFNVLTVYSYDRAGHISPDATYQFDIGDTQPTLTVAGPVIGGTPFQVRVAPGPNTGQILRYNYSVNGGAQQIVTPAADGTATIELTAAADTFISVSVSSVSANGWVSPPASWQQYVDTAPAITSAAYPENSDGSGSGGVGVPGTFTFTPRSADVVSYAYSFDFATPVTVPAGADGTASVDWTPDSAGFHELDVYAVAADGTQSDTYYYSLYVAGE